MQLRIPGFDAAQPGKRELTVYDTPERRPPEDKARDRARHEESHPFLYYLSQFVPGMRPSEGDALLPEAGMNAMFAGNARAAAEGVGLWGREAANNLFEARPDAAAPAAPPEIAPAAAATVPVAVSPLPAAQPAPVQAADDVPRLAPVAPAEIPRVVFGQVERMVQNGLPAATLKFQLNPEHLGKVDLAFTYAQQKVSVNVLAATHQAKEHLEMQLAHIRGILQAHHFQTGDLKVVLASESSGSQNGKGDQESGDLPFRYPRRRRRQPADEEAISAI